MDAPDPGSPSRRALVLIPGMRREERFFRRDVLVSNLETVERFPLERRAKVEVAGETGIRLSARPRRRPDQPLGVDVDVFEAYWADTIPDQAELGPWGKLAQGLDLLAYWPLNWRSWRPLFISPYITVGLMAGGFLLVVWYVALALLVADTINADPVPAETIKDLPVLGTLLAWFQAATSAIADWRLWALIGFILSIAKVDELVQLARFTKDYFEDKPDETEVGLRHRLRVRIRTTLENVLAASDPEGAPAYDEVFVVAHSFGTVAAVDLLADWPHGDDFERLTLVTLGSPIAVLRARSTWLAAEHERLLEGRRLRSWVDAHARTDWLCTAVPGHRERYPEHSLDLDFEAPLRQRLTGRTHMLYYRDDQVLEMLARPGPV